MLSTHIDLTAIAHNTRELKRRAGSAALIAVVKADGYGHGMVDCARVMARNGADMCGVVTIPEALTLIDALRADNLTTPVLCWMWRPGRHMDRAIAAGVQLGVPSLEHARAVAEQPNTVNVHVKVDTGLNRSGVDEEEWREVFSLLAAAPQVNVEGIFSHLACADEPGHESIDAQAETLRRAVEVARECGLNPPLVHLANSAAALTRPALAFTAIRPGLALYGLSPLPQQAPGEWNLVPAMTWCAQVNVVKQLHAGEQVSYGLTWTAPSERSTAVVSVGYADGMPRAVQTGRDASALWVTINGTRYQQVGRVCMDQIVVDLGDNAEGVKPGDTAVIFGPGTRGEMTATELAEALGTINYEIVCMPKGRTVRNCTAAPELEE